MAIKISYVPEQGMITNYYDCEAIAPDGSRWQAASNRWFKLADAPMESDKRPKKNAGSSPAPLYALFGFFVAMALFAKPVFMTFGDPIVGTPVLFGICCIVAAAFYRITSD